MSIVMPHSRIMNKEMRPTLENIPGIENIDLDKYEEVLIERFSNEVIADTLQRVAMDTSDKLSVQVRLVMDGVKTCHALVSRLSALVLLLLVLALLIFFCFCCFCCCCCCGCNRSQLTSDTFLLFDALHLVDDENRASQL